ncbi:hypothetical protein TNCV_2085041 [Trichonephila clavipes]|uniref:Uncharacterized protein n=1 Tax=Trichonephila clavipes TaxID=2585209 RepID=A0A8X6V7G5_TRICX|nr:hypothetical protein TNCV_2085041 [Trichonephila clavipes]
MDFTEINSSGKRAELLGRIDRQNYRFRTAKTIKINFGLHASFVELESAKNAVNEAVIASTNYEDEKRTATAGSDVVQSGRPIFDDFFQHLWPYIGNNTANVVFQMVKRLWLIRIDQ